MRVQNTTCTFSSAVGLDTAFIQCTMMYVQSTMFNYKYTDCESRIRTNGKNEVRKREGK